MNMRSVAAEAAVAVSIVVGLPAYNWAQVTTTYGPSADATPPRKTAATLRPAGDPFGAMRADFKRQFAFAAVDRAPPLEMKIREAAANVRDANDDATRQSATSKLTSLLDKYFEQDMTARTKELQDVQMRLANLQAQLERRRVKKQEIIDLQMKVALNEADGLGFYSGPKIQTFNVQVDPTEVLIPNALGEGNVYPAVPAPPLPAISPDRFAPATAPAAPTPAATPTSNW